MDRDSPPDRFPGYLPRSVRVELKLGRAAEEEDVELSPGDKVRVEVLGAVLSDERDREPEVPDLREPGTALRERRLRVSDDVRSDREETSREEVFVEGLAGNLASKIRSLRRVSRDRPEPGPPLRLVPLRGEAAVIRRPGLEPVDFEVVRVIGLNEEPEFAAPGSRVILRVLVRAAGKVTDAHPSVLSSSFTE
jgi:hypothetical protein